MLRRDIAIWGSLLGLAHMLVGMLIHSDHLQIWTLFITGLPNRDTLLPVRRDLFGLANYTGLLQGLILFLLLLISNQVALRRLGLRRWKTWQRLSYLGLASVMVHGLSYQNIERRELWIRLVFLAIILLVAALQLTGVFLRLRERFQRQDGRGKRRI
jgi:methionine sulfoxide reductase heme-binding subunit